MIRENGQRPAIGDGLRSAPVDTFEAAIQDVVQRTLALTSAIAKLDYDDGARARGQLECALSRAQVLTDEIVNGAERAEALHQLGEIHAIATRMLVIAPAPSLAAIEACETGEPTAWDLEKRRWIAGRLAIGTSPHLPMLRRGRHDTRPDSPRALRQAPRDGDDAAPAAEPPPNRSADVPPDQEDKP